MAKRMFLGLELSEGCVEALAGVDPKIPKLRWIRKTHLHLTLVFLGNVEPETEQKLIEQLSAVHSPSFALSLKGIGTFGRNRPSVIWAGVPSPAAELISLQKQLQSIATSLGIITDSRPFHPHITLSRPQGISARRLQPFLEERRETDFGTCEIREFVLFSSKLAPEGAIYEVVHRQKLGFVESSPLDS
jgi:2'-5' RNA ligase